MKETADEAVRMSPSVKHVIVYPRLGMQIPWAGGRDIAWREFVEGARKEFQTERTFAEDPFMIIYTSGTTGRPKGTVHVHCGFPIKAAQDMAHCFDLRKDDTMFWLTDLGWMMGPWEIIGCLLLGGRMLLYDGAIDYPAPDRLWQLVERHRVSVLGISPTAIRALMRTGEEWVRKHDLSSLRILGSTGEPWNPEPWFWYFRNVGGGRCPIINYSGGTEISGGIVGCSPIQPLKPCSFASPIPGMDADVVDGQGRSVRGEVGELVIRKPWPGMTRGFWKDPQKYLDTYWSRFPAVWVHGDWVSVDKDGMWFIHGRSDDTIKVSGKRVGPAEVESALVSHPSVSEAAAIGVPHDLKGEEVVCFVVLQIGSSPSDPLREELKDHVTGRLGKALRPEEVKFIDELPKTRNAKIMRRVLRGRYLGASDLGDLSSMENPAALEAIDRAI
ncbi:MAG: AMP-binding protein [Candidatus Binatota bacterium]